MGAAGVGWRGIWGDLGINCDCWRTGSLLPYHMGGGSAGRFRRAGGRMGGCLNCDLGGFGD